jgi:hypothetical protein
MKTINIIAILVIGGLLGLSFLFKWGFKVLVDESVSKMEYYQFVTNIFEAIGTCAAVIVALFLNEIRACFRKVSFDIALGCEDLFEELEDTGGTKRALKYYNYIQFFNKGNINAHNCELYLENATFFLLEDNKNGDFVSVGNEPINWGYNRSSMIYIPSHGKKFVRVFEMIAPQQQSDPNGKEDNTTPVQYCFLGFIRSIEAKKGKWELTYCLNTTNAKPVRIKLSVTWTGKWEQRQTDMKKFLTVKIEKV